MNCESQHENGKLDKQDLDSRPTSGSAAKVVPFFYLAFLFFFLYRYKISNDSNIFQTEIKDGFG